MNTTSNGDDELIDAVSALTESLTKMHAKLGPNVKSLVLIVQGHQPGQMIVLGTHATDAHSAAEACRQIVQDDPAAQVLVDALAHIARKETEFKAGVAVVRTGKADGEKGN